MTSKTNTPNAVSILSNDKFGRAAIASDAYFSFMQLSGKSLKTFEALGESLSPFEATVLESIAARVRALTADEPAQPSRYLSSLGENLSDRDYE